jgi:hypothetical protein
MVEIEIGVLLSPWPGRGACYGSVKVSAVCASATPISSVECTTQVCASILVQSRGISAISASATPISTGLTSQRSAGRPSPRSPTVALRRKPACSGDQITGSAWPSASTAGEQRRDHGFIRHLAAVPNSVAKRGERGDPGVDGAPRNLEPLGEGLVGGAQQAGMPGDPGGLGLVDGGSAARHGEAPRGAEAHVSFT